LPEQQVERSGLLTLVIGGARSGKSRYAENLITALPPPWIYIATAEACDAEMTERIAHHRARRDSRWTTIEAPRDLSTTLAAQSMPVLIDCLTLWLSNLLLSNADVDAEVERFDGVLAKARTAIVLVANEVGLGIVPENALARRFRDLQGLLNQRIAARVDRVVLLVAGIPLTIKGKP
jgi:adenosylcobinamide kinase/adenosylcobinamide-phosphate guanylyltransferase